MNTGTMNTGTMQSGTRWSAILAVAFVIVSTQLLWVTFTPITTETAASLHVSESAVGWLSEVFPLVYVVITIPCGLLTDRWFRGSLVVGAVLTGVGALIRCIPGFSMILVGQILISIGQPLMVNAINKVGVVYAGKAHRTTAIAIGSASMFVGILLAMLSGPLLLGAFGLRAVLWSQAVFTLVSVIALLPVLRHAPLYPAPAGQSGSLAKAWRDGLVRRMCLLLFIGFGLFIAVTTWLQVLLAAHGVTSVEVGVALALMTAAGIVGAGVLPDWAQRTNRNRQVLVASLVVSILMVLYIYVGQPFWIMTCLLVVCGGLILADLPIVLSTAERHVAPEDIGTVTALLMLCGNAGGIILALLVQVAIGHQLVAICILVIASVAAIPAARRFPNPKEMPGSPARADDSAAL